MLLLFEQVLLLQVDRVACLGHHVAGGIEQQDRKDFARASQFVGGGAGQAVEHRLQPITEHGTLPLQAPDERTHGIGDVFGAVPQVGPGVVLDPNMLPGLPGGYQRPNGRQQDINKQVAAR